MKGEIKRFKSNNGAKTVAKREIAGNTYIVAVIPVDDRKVSHRVAVYADKVDGSDNGFPAGAENYKVRDKYTNLVSTNVKHNEKLAPVIAKLVNRAVDELTGHLEDTKSQEDAVLSALEANAEAHEGDDDE